MTTETLAMLIPIVSVIAVFAYTSVAAWADSRTKEREVFYRTELFKKLADSPAPQAQQVLVRIREQEQSAERKAREGQRLGGVIVTLVGLGLISMFALLTPHRSIWAIGLVPLAVGVALLLYAYVLAPKLPASVADRGELH
jgi:hypothetical protein